MKKYSPGASINSNYCFICDCCEVDDGRPSLVWHNLPRRKGHFVLCYDCLKKLYLKYFPVDYNIIVKRAFIPEELRNEVFKRDEYRCLDCGSQENLQLDHIFPFSKGGETTKENLQTLCKTCNLKKGNSDG